MKVWRKKGEFKKWQLNYKEKIKDYNSKRQNKNHKITKSEWNACKLYFNESCAYCGLHIDNHYIKYAGKLKKIDLHKEHVYHYGDNDLSNCVPSCRDCNSEKWKYDLKYWYNENNPKFSKENLNKIYKWLQNDYKEYFKN